MVERTTFRPHALDGAMLWFQPTTGVHVRWDGLATRAIRRTAPRVVMFGITNRCNLSCGFCSRDLHAGSRWTVDTAFDVLAGLAREGTLEVAFGGGEPLAFKGFDELVRRLVDETALAVHFTTNGALLTDERLACLRPLVSEIRLSIYDDTPWESCIARLAEADGSFGANVLVTPERMCALPALLERLADLGCRDVALLSYVGDDRSLHLDPEDDRELRDIVAGSPIRTRLSVCFADRLDPVPRLFDGVDGDCGAGSDFLVVTSDGGVKACSFHDTTFSIDDGDAAAEVLRKWRERRDALRSAASRGGCARSASETRSAEPLSEGVRVWQGFSGNNSGDCVLVGRFETFDAARAYVAELIPGFVPGSYSDEWRALLEGERIRVSDKEYSPDQMGVIGRSAIVHTESTLGDDFPSLRTLSWKRGGRAVYNGIHEHGGIEVLAGLGFDDATSLEKAVVALATAGQGSGTFHRRGLEIFGTLSLRLTNTRNLGARVELLEEVAKKHDGVFSGDLVCADEPIDVAAALARRTATSKASPIERLWVHFESQESAAKFARKLQGAFVCVDRYVLIEAERIGPRLGYIAQRQGGVATLLTGDEVRLGLNFFVPEAPPWKGKKADLMPAPDPKATGDELFPYVRPFLHGAADVALTSYYRSVGGYLLTKRPLELAPVVAEFARGRGLQLWLGLRPRDRLVDAIARVSSDLHELRVIRRGPR